jgi:glycosyltransferase involved in cell wall biosynthesis
MKSKEDVIAIIPAYNEEKTISNVVKQTKKYIDDVLVIDDNSSDKTADLAKKAGAKVISHILNRGVGLAQRTGFNYTFDKNYDYMVQLDADGQHDPKYIPELLKKLKENNLDIVIGSRFLNSSYKKWPIHRKTGIKFYSFVVNFISGLKITDVTSGYRVYRVDALKRLTEISDKNWAIEQTLEAGIKGLKVGEYSVKMMLRQNGQSQFDLESFFRYPFRMAEAMLKVILFRRLS